jgi:hypothetical protein
LLRRKPGVAANTAMQLSPMRCGIPNRAQYFRGPQPGLHEITREALMTRLARANKVKLTKFELMRSQDRQYTLRRTTTARRGATTTGRTTGRRTTTAPPAPAQPARYTPRAQTTALASIVFKAMKPPASNSEIIRCFMTVLLEVQSVNRHTASLGGDVA